VTHEPTGLNPGQREEDTALEQHTTQAPVEPSPTWEHLETWLRSKMREWLQELLEAEVDELLELVTRVPGHRESTAAWSDVLRDLKARGMESPHLAIGDGHLGIWAGLRNFYPDAQEQRCWNHRIINALDTECASRNEPGTWLPDLYLTTY